MRARAAIAAAALALAGLSCSVPAAEAGGGSMVVVPAGLYTPFQRTKPANASSPPLTSTIIGAFRLDIEPVTNADFLGFVIAHPEWRKSRIKPLFADARYLNRWPSDFELADAEMGAEPVTNVSWFAAEAYCRARGLRLPTTDQWEYALADNGRGQEDVRSRSLEWLAEPNRSRLPAVGAGRLSGFGVRDMVGLIWEWTLDYDAYSATAESRDPNGKDSAAFCGGASAGVADPTDYPAFMRYALRASLKARYTADNVGFRCAGDAS
jgi:formylglycine-generating enzyme required for sulfatase activity